MSTNIFLSWFAAQRCQQDSFSIGLQPKDVNKQKMSTILFLNWFAAERCQQEYVPISLQLTDVNKNMSQLVCSSQMSTRICPN